MLVSKSSKPVWYCTATGRYAHVRTHASTVLVTILMWRVDPDHALYTLVFVSPFKVRLSEFPVW